MLHSALTRRPSRNGEQRSFVNTRLEPRLSIHLINFAPEGAVDWSRLIANAEAADRSGIDKLIVSDHVVFGERLDEYGRPELGGIVGGRQPTGPDGHWLEPVTLLSFIAARTARVRLATHVLLAALRRPIVLAKALSTLDVLSGGRLDVGVGVGWQRAEYDAAGLSFEDRGRLLDESLALCQTMWRAQVATIVPNGATVERLHQMPKPLQPDGVPIWIGGRASPRTARRIAQFAAGWIPWGDDARDLPESIPRMRRLVATAGGNPDDLRIVGNLTTATVDGAGPDIEATMTTAERLVSAGATDLVARIPLSDATASDEIYRAWVDAFSRRVK